MEGNSGLSRARLRKKLRDSRPPAPIPQDVVIAAGGSVVPITVLGMNITPSTQILVLADAAAADETAGVAPPSAVVPSGQTSSGSVTASVTFTNIPGGTADLFRVYLTGPYGQRIFVGTVSTP